MAQQVEAAAAVTLASFPDDAFLLVVAACGDTEDGVPLLEAVKGLGGLCEGMQQQLRRLRPLVGVRSLAVVQRPAHVPWHIVLLYTGVPTMAVLEQARQRRVRSIVAMHGPQPRFTTLAPAVARRVVPCLLGAGCSLLKLEMWHARLNNTWAATFGEAAVGSAVLRELTLFECGLRGPLPELKLPALLKLCVTAYDCSRFSTEPNQLTGSLEPLRGCTALQELSLSNNQLTGGLKPLERCTALKVLALGNNQLTGDLEPLRSCTALQELALSNNLLLTGGLEPLRSCAALERLGLSGNNLTGGLEPLRGCTALEMVSLCDNQLTGGLEPLRGCTALEQLEFENTQLTPSDEDKAHFEKQCGWEEDAGSDSEGSEEF